MDRNKDWPRALLKQITLKIGSGATPRGGKNSYKDEGISLIRSLNVYDFRFDYDGLVFIDDDQAQRLSNVEVECNDILLNITGASVARCCVVPTKVLPARVNQHVAIVRVDSNLANPHFVLNVINSPWYKHHLLTLAHGGATREALTKEKIENFEIPLPFLPTQRKIASILSAYDDLIENNTRRIQVLEEMAQTIYREWFINFRFPGHEGVRMVDSGTELGEVPEGWEKRIVKDFGEVITGKTPSKKVDEYWDSPDIPFIRTPDMHDQFYCIQTIDYLSQAGADSQRHKYLPPNSLCVSCIGTVGIVTITGITAQTNQQINSIVLTNHLDLEFLYFSLLDLKDTIHLFSSTGATMSNLSKGKFMAMKVTTPSENFREKYHDIVSSMFGQIKNLQQKNANLRSTRDLLLPRLVSGEVDVSEVEIADV